MSLKTKVEVELKNAACADIYTLLFVYTFQLVIVACSIGQ